MTSSDDFHDEMNPFGKHDHDEEERLLRGESSAADPELFLRLREAKRVLTDAPRAAVATAHLAAIVEETHLLASRPHGNPAHAPDAGRTRQIVRGRVVRKVRRAAVSTVVAAAAIMGSVAGLAYAGVSLPSPALTAFHKLGINLPDNRGNGGQPGLGVPTPRPSNHGQVVRVVAHQTPGGCEHGQAVSDVASSKRQDSHAGTHRHNTTHQQTNPCAQSGKAAGTQNTSSTGSQTGNQQNSTGHGKGHHPAGTVTHTSTGAHGSSTGHGKSHNIGGTNSNTSTATHGRSPGFGKDTSPGGH